MVVVLVVDMPFNPDFHRVSMAVVVKYFIEQLGEEVHYAFSLKTAAMCCASGNGILAIMAEAALRLAPCDVPCRMIEPLQPKLSRNRFTSLSSHLRGAQ